MIEHSIQRLQFLCDTIPPLLAKMDEQAFSSRPAPAKWSKKEILGHLIDSAANNHQRFVRGQFEDVPKISYDQNAWNTHGYYDGMDSQQVISFWTSYNRQLLALIKLIPAEKLLREVNTGGPNNETIEFLINDYVVHMEHHLRQVVAY